MKQTTISSTNETKSYIDEIIGQEHLVGEGKIISRMVDAKRLLR